MVKTITHVVTISACSSSLPIMNISVHITVYYRLVTVAVPGVAHWQVVLMRHNRALAQPQRADTQNRTEKKRLTRAFRGPPDTSIVTSFVRSS